MRAHVPAYVLRRSFELDAFAPDARLYATAHGCYETFLNEQRVGDLELTPGFTSYEARLDVQTYDVTDLLVPGENVWTVVLSDGWYRGRTGFGQTPDSYGDTVAFLGQLHVGDTVVATDESWQSSTGADRRRRPHGRTARGPSGCSRRCGTRSAVAHHDRAALTVSPSPPVRRVEELRPVGVRRIDAERQVVDLGQNINGWVRLTDLGPADTELTLVHGEALDASGDVTQDHLAGGDHTDGGTLPVGQIDHVVSAGREGDGFEPRHTTHGFQYVRIEGHPHRLTPDDVTGHRGAHRPAPHGMVPVQRRAHQPLPRDRRLELPRQRVRDPDRLSAARALGVDRRLAGVPPERGVPLRRRRLLADWLRDLAVEQRPDGCVRNYRARIRSSRGTPGGTH